MHFNSNLNDVNMRYPLLFISILFYVSGYAYEMLSDTIPNSSVYPNTVHTYKVSIPDGYDGNTPACLYVGLDGPLYQAPDVIDSLIKAGDMPITIGVYFQPGVVKDMYGKTVRYNRSNEYDAIDGRLARFIETELLPAASRLTTADGRRVCISDNPDCRAISGASSGGIGSFVVAWQRPDLFRRVFTTCGTYVSMRGGDLLPAIVRKTEPLPLRMFIHDGSKDAWNPLFGHWFEQNQLLASSLKFAGYDIDCRWDDTGHSIIPGTKLFPDVMKWLWRDYPRSLTPGNTANNFITPLLEGETGWQLDTTTVVIPAQTTVVYPDSSYIVKVLPGSQWLQTANIDTPHIWQNTYLLHDMTFTDPGVVGMAFDSDGNLYVATSMGIQIADQNGRVRAILRYPSHTKPVAFQFNDNTLYIQLEDKVYSRSVKATAAPLHKINVKSQGPS